MSNVLRQKRGNTIVFALLALVILGLGGFGVTNFGGRITKIGTVGDEAISTSDYGRALQSEMRAMSAQMGQPLTIEQAQQLGLDRSVQAQLFASAALDHESRRIGISAGDGQVRQTVMAIPAFRGGDGKFDAAIYRQRLQQEGLTDAEFEGTVRRDAVRGLMERIVAGGAAAPATYVDRVAAYIGEERDFVLAELLPGDLPAPVASPTDAEVKSWYDAHNDAFMRPEIRKITYVWMSPDKVAETVTVDDAALKAAYEARIGEFRTPETREVARLVFPTKADADAAKAAIDAGTTTFEKATSDRGLTLADIDMGPVSKDGLGAAGDAVFALAAPGVVGPVDTDLGPALFSVTKILPAEETSFEDAKPDLEAEAKLDRARRMIADKSAEIEDLLASGETLETVAQKTGMDLASIDYSKQAQGGITGYEAFRKAADAVTAEDFPELGQLDDGGVFALRLDSIEAPKLRPFDEVKADAAAAWTADATHKALVALAGTVKGEVDGGGSLSKRGLVTTFYTRFARTGHIDAAPAEVVTAAFATPKDKAETIDADGRVFVVQVTAIHAIDPAAGDSKQLTDAIAEQTRQAVSQDIFTLYAQAVQAEAGITLDENAIAAVNAQVR
jgi:peptidyl-prolyl cis-trans isomerase D